jgi:hypothetical protein
VLNGATRTLQCTETRTNLKWLFRPIKASPAHALRFAPGLWEDALTGAILCAEHSPTPQTSLSEESLPQRESASRRRRAEGAPAEGGLVEQRKAAIRITKSKTLQVDEGRHSEDE